MAETELNEHVSTSNMELFCRKSLSDTELATVARHLTKCSDCHQRLVATLGRGRGVTALSFTLAPEFWLRHEHIDYEHLNHLASNRLDGSDRELIDLHLKACSPCREDVRSFLVFRDKIAPELQVTYVPVEREPTREGPAWSSWWEGLAWKPIYATAIIVIGIAILIGASLLLKRRAENLQAQQTPTPQVSPASTRDELAANVPSTPAMPNQSPVEKPNRAEAFAVLNDSGAKITVDRSGNVVGLAGVPGPTRDQIARVLLSERLEQPAILKKLEGQDATHRGSNYAQPFKLTYPSRTVVVSDRPTLRWEPASGATSYRVYVNDPTGHEVAKSDELPPERTEWTAPKPFMRGRIYTWTVIAVVAGREIVSPDPSSPEMKFQVLSTSSVAQLNKLKKARSHLALGVFYAREGMTQEAEGEFKILVRENPNSEHANKLLREVQSWRSR